MGLCRTNSDGNFDSHGKIWQNSEIMEQALSSAKIPPILVSGVGAMRGELSPWLNKIHHGDCLRVLAKMPSESVDLAVTSPPYNIKNSTGNGLKNGNGGKWPRAENIR